MSVLGVAFVVAATAPCGDDDSARSAYATMAQGLASPVSLTFEAARRPVHSDTEVIRRVEIARLAPSVPDRFRQRAPGSRKRSPCVRRSPFTSLSITEGSDPSGG